MALNREKRWCEYRNRKMYAYRFLVGGLEGVEDGGRPVIPMSGVG